MNLQNDTSTLLKKHGLFAKKSLGQNFLISEKSLNKIVEAGEIEKDDFILEIGPGTGILTRELKKYSNNVLSLEKDTSFKEVLSDCNVEFTDALQFNPNNLPKNYKVIANIPYYITSPLISQFLKADNRPTIMVLLTQKEVAEKIADPKRNSVLSLNVKTFGTPTIIANVPASHFMPPPKVDSAILKIVVDKKPPPNLKKYFQTIHVGFSSPRKKLSNNLKPLGITQSQTSIDLNRRAETLNIEEWQELSHLI